MKATISTFISCRNHGKYLRQAAESCLRQSYRPSQLILINDASTDDSLEVMEGLKKEWDGRSVEVKVLNFENPIGHIQAYNLGIKYSTGEFVHLMSADDIVNNRMFYELGVGMMSDSPHYANPQHFHGQSVSVHSGSRGKNVGVVTSSLRHMDEEGNWMHHLPENGWPSMWETILSPREALEEMTRRGNFVAGISLVRREAYASVAPYSVEHPYAADWLMWVRLLGAGWHLGVLRGAMFSYRHHGGQMTAKTGAPKGERESIYKELVGTLRKVA